MIDDRIKLLLFLGVLLIMFIAFPLIKLSSITEFCDTVEEKWIKYHNEGAKYLISTKNHGVLENTDELIVWKWDSSDVYAKITDGEYYCFKVIGWRIPLLSWYQNIITVNKQ